MSSFSTQVAESEKFGVLPARLDDLKKLWKILKSSLLESLTTFNSFGKSLSKASRNLHFTFNHADPSFFCKLTLVLLTRQAQTSHILSQSVNEAVSEISKEMEAYEEKLEQVRAQTFDTISEALKFLTSARLNYAKEKANYEKACKEAEFAVSEKKKPINDPFLYYNLTHHRRLKRKVMEAVQALNTAEQVARDALEVYSVRQKGLNLGLSESMHSFKGVLQTVFERMMKTVKRHNKVLISFLAKEFEDLEKSNVLASMEEFTFASEAEEQQFINNRKLTHGDSDSKESKESKLKFLDLHNKILQKPQEASETEFLDYCDMAQKHLDVSVLVFEDRQKVVKGLKGYMQEVVALCSNIEKTFQKLSKNSLSQISSSVLCKKLGTAVDPFFDSLEAFGAMFNQLTSFVNTKSSALDGIVADQKEYYKAFQSLYSKSIKDAVNLKIVVASLGLQVEKLYKKIAETADKDPSDERIPTWKMELDSVRKQREEHLQELRKQTVEAAKGVAKAFEDHRAREQTKYADFNAIIKGIITQENGFFRNLSEALSVMEGNLEGKDIVVTQALTQDDLNGYLQYYELNMQENLNGQRAKDPNLVFPKIYTPPADVLAEEEGDKLVIEAEETEEQPMKEQDEDEEYFKKRFGLKSTEKVLDTFACGIEQTIIRQGRMYVYPSAICFSTVKLLGNFALKIPVTDMIRVEKKTMTLVFDTALSIITKNGEIKFLSFFSRDKAFSLIASLPNRDMNPVPSPERMDKKSSSSSSEDSPKQEPVVINEEKRKQIEEIVRQRVNRSMQDLDTNQGELRRASLVLSEESEKNEEGESNESADKLPVLDKKVHSLEEKSVGLAVTMPIPTHVLKREGKAIGESEHLLKKAHTTGEVKIIKSSPNVGEDSEVVKEVKTEKKEARRKGTEEVKIEEESEKNKMRELMKKREVQIRAPIKGDDIYPLVIIKEVFSCSAVDFFGAVFSDRKITHKGKPYDCFWMLAKVAAGDTEVKYTKWSPTPPYEGLIEDKTSLECLKKVAEGTQISTRGFVYTHPVKDGGPFVPKTCQVEEKQTGYWVSAEEFVMQMDVFTSKIPLSDTFVVKNSFKVKDVDGGKCEFTWRLGVEFVKSTMFRGKIEKTSKEENGLYANNIVMPILKENVAAYLKEKEVLVKRRDAKKQAEKEAAQKLKAESAAAATTASKEATEATEAKTEANVVVEEKKEESVEEKIDESADESGKEEEVEKEGKVGLRESIEGEIAKVLKMAEQSKEEMKSEIKGLKMLILGLLAMNCMMMFFMFLKK